MWNTTKYKQHTVLELPKNPGVYIIAEDKKISVLDFILSKVIIYVGKSSNIQKRILEHLNPNEVNPSLNNIHINKNLTLYWFELPLSQITKIESKLIKCLQPIANSVGIKKNQKGECK